MCLRLSKEGNIKYDYEEEGPCKCCKIGHKSFVPTRDDLSNDIANCYYCQHKSKKRHRSYAAIKGKQWLIENPVTDIMGIEFLKLEELRFNKATSESNLEAKQNAAIRGMIMKLIVSLD